MTMETGTGMTLRNREKTSYEEPDPAVIDDFDLNIRAENENQDEIPEAAEESLNRLTDADLQKEIEEEERKIEELREKRKREENERRLLELRRSRLEIESQCTSTNTSSAKKSVRLRTNLQDLRNDTRLGRDTDRAIKNLRIFESDSESDSDQESMKTKREDKSNKLRSGKTLKLSSRVVRQEKWPHCFLPCSQKGGADKKYDDLTVEEFVSGFAVILTELSPSSATQLQEFQARTAHLARLMELATIYHWKAVRNFHSRCLLQIEIIIIIIFLVGT